MELLWRNHQWVVYALVMQTSTALAFYSIHMLRLRMKRLPLFITSVFIGHTLFQIGKVIVERHFLIPKQLCAPQDWLSLNIIWAACYLVVIFNFSFAAFLIADLVSVCSYTETFTLLNPRAVSRKILDWLGIQMSYHSTILKVALATSFTVTFVFFLSLFFLVGGIFAFLIFWKNPFHPIKGLWCKCDVGSWITLRYRFLRIFLDAVIILALGYWLLWKYSPWTKKHFEVSIIPLAILEIIILVHYLRKRKRMKAEGKINPNPVFKVLRSYLFRPFWRILLAVFKALCWLWRFRKALKRKTFHPLVTEENWEIASKHITKV